MSLTPAIAMPRYDPAQRPSGERRVLLDRLGARPTVLDVGCWSGFTGAHLIGSANAVVDGIEPDDMMAAIAARTYRRVLCARAEDGIPALSAEDARYDAVLFMDVLEHLENPLQVLRRSVALLSPGGRILASIPNVAHWSLRKALMLGRWEYEDSGLMDRTHLRFFTLRSAEELLEQAGLRIRWRSFAMGQPPLLRLPESRLALLRRWPELFAVQLLFDAEPC